MSDQSTTERQVPIEDPQFYLDNPWPTFEWMQREAPFYMYEHDVIAGAPATVQKHEMAGRLVAPR